MREATDEAAACYRRASRRVLAGALDEALALYEQAALLGPDYSDPAFNLGETVAYHASRRPSGPCLSCRRLEEGLHFQGYSLKFCCTSHGGNQGWTRIGTFKGGVVPIDYVLARRTQVIAQLQKGIPNRCTGCHELETRSWEPRSALIGDVIFNNYSICNMRCSYCALAEPTAEAPDYHYLIGPAVDHLIANGWLARDAHVTWGGGEPGVNREFDRTTGTLLAHGCRFNICTNATRILPSVRDALAAGRCDLCISVDSGTPATFYRVKYRSGIPVKAGGRPAFDAVWASIGAYAGQRREALLVKYIFTSDNCGEEDLTGFLDLCATHGVTRIMLTPEASDVRGGKVPGPVWKAMVATRARALAAGLFVAINPIDPAIPDIPDELK